MSNSISFKTNVAIKRMGQINGLITNQFMSYEDIYDMMDLSKRAIKAYLKYMNDNGWVLKSNEGTYKSLNNFNFEPIPPSKISPFRDYLTIAFFGEYKCHGQ